MYVLSALSPGGVLFVLNQSRVCKPQSHHVVDHFAKLFSQQPLCSHSMLMIVYLYSLLTSFRCSANWAGTQCERPAPKSSRSDNMSGGEDWECQEALTRPVWIPACVTGSLTLLHFSGTITRTSGWHRTTELLPTSALCIIWAQRALLSGVSLFELEGL